MKIIFTLFVILIQLAFSLSIFAEEKWFKVEPVSREVKIIGFTRAQAVMPLASEVEGKVNEIFSDIGEPISEKKQFACLDDTFSKIDIKSAEQEMSRSYVDIKYYKKEVFRYKQLVKKQTSAVSVLDGIVRDLNVARHALSAASVRKQRFEELMLRHCVEAPEGWLVIDRSIELGQWVNQGEVIAHIGNYSQLKVSFTLSQLELDALKATKSDIELFFPEYNLMVPATIEHISPAFDDKTRKILVDLLIKDRISMLRGGMRARLTLKIVDSKNTLFTISKLVLEERFEEFWMERRDGKKIRVKLSGEQSNERVIISSDKIKLGDQFKAHFH